MVEFSKENHWGKFKSELKGDELGKGACDGV